VAKLSVDDGARASLPGSSAAARPVTNTIHQKSEEDIERQRQRMAAQEEENARRRRQTGWWAVGVALLTLVLMAGLTAYFWIKHLKPVATVPGPNTNVASRTSFSTTSSMPAQMPLALPIYRTNQAKKVLIQQYTLPVSHNGTTNGVDH
jgi:hypothetical protein